MAELGVGDDAVLVIRRKVTVAGRYVDPSLLFEISSHRYPSTRSLEQDAEMMRLQVLGDPELMRQLREVKLAAIVITSRMFTLHAY